MPDIAPAAPPVDLAALIPTQRVAEGEPVLPAEPVAPAPEQLAFLWSLLGALAGSAIVAVAFLVLITLLP